MRINQQVQTTAERIQKLADIMAVSASTLCFFHCLFTPVALIFLPVLGANALDNEYFHKIMLFLVSPLLRSQLHSVADVTGMF